MLAFGTPDAVVCKAAWSASAVLAALSEGLAVHVRNPRSATISVMPVFLAISSLSFAPADVAFRPGRQAVVTQAALTMQEVGQPDIISTDGGYMDAPTPLKEQLGAVGPLGYWDPLGMVCSCPATLCSSCHALG